MDRPNSLITSTSTIPTTSQPINDNGQAVSTLLSAYSSANLSLATANSQALASISAMVSAQQSYESVLSAGGTPTFVAREYFPLGPPDVNVLLRGAAAAAGAVVPSTTTIPAISTTGTTKAGSSTGASSTPNGASTAATSSSSTGNASRFYAKFSIIGLVGFLIASVAMV